MSEDGLLPSVFRKSKRGIYRRGTTIVGAALTIIAAGVPFSVLWDIISVGVLLSFNLTNLSLVQIRYGNGGQISEPQVDGLSWVMFGSTGVAGFTLYYGVMRPCFDPELPIDWTMTAICIITVLCSFVAAGVIYTFEIRCDMDDPTIFKAFGVPFVPCVAMLFNFFLLAVIAPVNILCFGAFMVVVMGVYVGYVWTKRRVAKNNSHQNVDSTGSENFSSTDVSGSESNSEE
uniref:Cationic amino acid transporter C-terminal domain-containing protein n=1 Tax=Zooxanthella nutricula TaxID=1333877 RepID=A0A7S2M724_9DINO